MAKAITDKKVLALIEKARAKKEAISKAEKSQWATNCSFSFYPDNTGTRVNLHVADEAKIVHILAFLLRLTESYVKASSLLGLDPAFKWNGYTFDEWRDDLITRLTKLHISKEKANLKKIEERLDKLISPELKKQMELEELEKELQD